MRSAAPDDKIVFFFGGHGEYAEVNMMGLQVGEDSDFQCIIAGDDRRIYGTELRSWFCRARYPSVAVTTVFDASLNNHACHSGGSLGLHISYDIKGTIFKASNGSRKRVRLPMIQISASQPYEVAYSSNFNDGFYGQWTYSLLGYLKGTECPTIEGLAAYLEKNCDPTGAQVPQVCSSHKIKGRIALF
ncbi:hypothetical protein M407DRAFT_32930 [Tulasnella calospora MUT 4182]|uniref:Caspase family p20 domain-containing protein n=1 Tax=Tulasnella calospora MUT 4182 TaxID=1051891 RepID=A0A0C3PRW1_9AGAM|nr:hypothetical protein M407DRAFT_32930 [Tulasnella calospora MUT 4182]